MTIAKGMMMIDNEFRVNIDGKYFVIINKTRTLRVKTTSTKLGLEWSEFFMRFYLINRVPRSINQPHRATFPVRENIDVKTYTLSKDYMAAVAVAILGAQKEIFIASWKNTPSVLLCRPPLPPVRLDQLLKYKAGTGVKVYVLLYKEVELADQGNDSQGAMDYLTRLSPNILCIRHPNKLIGGSTAILWSHHEKLVVIDRLA
jgi:phospholipase D1/2